MLPVRVSNAGVGRHRPFRLRVQDEDGRALRYGEQFSAAHKQIHQRTGDKQPVRGLHFPEIVTVFFCAQSPQHAACVRQ